MLGLSCAICLKLAGQSATDPSYPTSDSGTEATSENEQLPALRRPTPRSLSSDSLTALRHRPAFAYMRYADSLFRNLNQSPVSPVAPSAESDDSGGFNFQGLRALYWLLALAAVVWLVLMLTIGKSGFFWRNARLKGQPNHADAQSEAPESTPEATLAAALAAADYRQATRQLFLLTVQKLGQKGLLVLAPTKTNFDYQSALKPKDCQLAFAQLALAYEYTWFGEFVPQPTQFDTIHEQFKTFWKQWT
jgi:hypothetical protein